jgi:site-specific DNA-cytosine methylase
MSRWHTVSAVDLDKAACAVYRANFRAEYNPA